MTTTKKAFPSPQDVRVTGMDLRDWFAGQAIAKASQILNGSLLDDEVSIARQAYAIADAMMKARDQ